MRQRAYTQVVSSFSVATTPLLFAIPTVVASATFVIFWLKDSSIAAKGQNTLFYMKTQTSSVVNQH